MSGCQPTQCNCTCHKNGIKFVRTSFPGKECCDCAESMTSLVWRTNVVDEIFTLRELVAKQEILVNEFNKRIWALEREADKKRKFWRFPW